MAGVVFKRYRTVLKERASKVSTLQVVKPGTGLTYQTLFVRGLLGILLGVKSLIDMNVRYVRY